MRPCGLTWSGRPQQGVPSCLWKADPMAGLPSSCWEFFTLGSLAALCLKVSTALNTLLVKGNGLLWDDKPWLYKCLVYTARRTCPTTCVLWTILGSVWINRFCLAVGIAQWQEKKIQFPNMGFGWSTLLVWVWVLFAFLIASFVWTLSLL